MDLFDFSKPLKRGTIKGAQTQGYVAPPTESIYRDDLVVTTKKGKEYVKEYLKKEETDSAEVEQPFDPNTGRYIPGPSSYSQVDDLTSVGTVANLSDFSHTKASINVYHRYKFDQVPPVNLSVSKNREKILDTIKNYHVTVIQGATGCGKTTQVPQFILNSYAQHQEYCNIVITQPRRIAALSVAHRVAFERDCEVGTLVGYQVGLDKHFDTQNHETRLLYCTTGVLLEKLINAKHLDDYTHIILDEVHERDQETDFLLIVLKKLMTRSPRTRIVLMSATIEAQKLASFFPFTVYGKKADAPIIEVGDKQNFDVKIFYLDDLDKLNFQYLHPEFHKPSISDEMIKIAIYLLKNFDHIEQNNITTGVINARGYALVFLPGLIEIERMHEMITQDNDFKTLKWSVYVLHSSITIQEQDTALKNAAPPGHRKIFLSTNIAESSLTMKNVKYVIDFCLTKQMMCESGTSFTHLQLCWASHSNCVQRAGRVGRTEAGKVYRLVRKEFYEVDMLPRLQPEICINPLDRVILRAKILDIGSPTAILASAVDPPDLSNIELTVASLKEMGALLLTANGEYQPDDGDLTFAGRIMANLPLDPRLSKLILFGHILGCADDCIKIACALSNKSLFSTPFLEKFKSYNAKLIWANASSSDLIATLNAFSAWLLSTEQNMFRNTGKGNAEQNEERWMKDYFLQVYPLRATYHLKEDVEKRLLHLNIKSAINSKVNLQDSEKALLLKVAIAGAFYPQYFTRGVGNSIDEQEALRTLNNNDPFSTVYLQGLPGDQPGRLYIKQIKKLLEPCARPDLMRVSFDNSSKVYVQFFSPNFEKPENPMGIFYGKPKYPGKVHYSVYGALKLRQLRVPLKLQVLHAEEAQSKAQELNLIQQVNECFGKNFADVKPKLESFIPTPDTKKVCVSVTHVEDPSHFWVIYNTDVMKGILSAFSKVLNKPGNLVEPKTIIIGQIYAVMFQEAENEYYRARILNSKPSSVKGKPDFQYKVFFIDYGNTHKVSRKEVMAFGPQVQEDLKEELRKYHKLSEMKELSIEKIPELAIQCSLSEVKPSQMRNPTGLWTAAAIERFTSMTLNMDFVARIYSIVYGKIAVELEDIDSPKTINNILLDEGLAERCEEGFMSKMDHFRRTCLQGSPSSFSVDESVSMPYSKLWEHNEDFDLGNYEFKRKTRQIFLRGPSSPLEMKVHAISRGTQRTSVNIEWNSVNSVLLDTEPQNLNDRLLVASYVSINEAGDVLSLRDTTIMPNIRGLVGLMCLIFAPCAELRINKQGTKMTGALFGLGYDPVTNESYHPINDVEIGFDAEFNLGDIECINKIRFWLNKCFYNPGGEDFLEALTCQSKVKDYLLQLLRKKRRYQNLDCPTKAFKWNALPKKFSVAPGENYSGDTDVFKLHSGVILEKNEPVEVKNDVYRNLLELYKISTNDIKDYSDGICKLCNNVSLRNRASIIIHLQLPEHRENELKMFKRNLEDFKEIRYVKPQPDRIKTDPRAYGQAGEKFERAYNSKTRAHSKPKFRDPRLSNNREP